jgi:hypothetical protein
MKKNPAAIAAVSVILTSMVCDAGFGQTGGNDVGGKRNDVKIKLSWNGKEAVIGMNDNPAARDFLTLLPLALTFEDYAGAEKIGYLPRKLSTQGLPAGFDPSVGDLTLYAPWGNLAIFYKDRAYAAGLVPLGRVESGMERLTAERGHFTVKAEKID